MIVLARPQDVLSLPAIERAAARLFEGLVPPSLLEETSDVAELAAAQAAGRLWVALADDVPTRGSGSRSLTATTGRRRSRRSSPAKRRAVWIRRRAS
jgi:hypothetical protein